MGNSVELQPDEDRKMAARGVLCLVLLSGLGLALARSYEGATPQSYPPANLLNNKPHCACTNPFICTANSWKGDPDTLCGSSGPGFCYVDCNADCSDIKPTASASRCQSANACAVERGTLLQGVWTC